MNDHSSTTARSRSSRGVERSPERRAALVAAAREIVRERGFHKTRLADVGARVGLTAPAVAYWFPNKVDLLVDALVSSDEERFYAVVEPALTGLADPVDRLRVAVGLNLTRTDWVLWVELSALALRQPVARAGLDAIDARWHALLAEILRDGVQRGTWRSGGGGVDQTALRLATLMDGLGIQLILRDLPIEEVARSCGHALAAELGVVITGEQLLAAGAQLP